MSDKTRRAEVRVLEIGSRMVRLSVDGGRSQWLSVGDVLWVDVPVSEPSPPAGVPMNLRLLRGAERELSDTVSGGAQKPEAVHRAIAMLRAATALTDEPTDTPTAEGGVVDGLHAAQQAQFDQTGRTIKPEVPKPPSQREAMTNYRPVARDDAIGSWARGDNVTIQDQPATLTRPAERFAYNHTRQEFTIGSWGEDKDAEPEGGRWATFSDAEVLELRAALTARCGMRALPTDVLERAEAIGAELREEISRRRTGYRGPGVYETFTGLVYEVLGRVGEDGAVILRRVGSEDGMLYAEVLTDFNDVCEDGAPAYRWVRALGEEA